MNSSSRPRGSRTRSPVRPLEAVGVVTGTPEAFGGADVDPKRALLGSPGSSDVGLTACHVVPAGGGPAAPPRPFRNTTKPRPRNGDEPSASTSGRVSPDPPSYVVRGWVVATECPSVARKSILSRDRFTAYRRAPARCESVTTSWPSLMTRTWCHVRGWRGELRPRRPPGGPGRHQAVVAGLVLPGDGGAIMTGGGPRRAGRAGLCRGRCQQPTPGSGRP